MTPPYPVHNAYETLRCFEKFSNGDTLCLRKALKFIHFERHLGTAMMYEGLRIRRFFRSSDSDTDYDLRMPTSTRLRLHSESSITRYITSKRMLSQNLFSSFTFGLPPHRCNSDAASACECASCACSRSVQLMLPFNVAGMTAFKSQAYECSEKWWGQRQPYRS